MICYPYRRTIRKGVKSRMWRGRIRLSPQDGMHDIPLYTTEKQSAWAEVRKAALELQQERAGTIRPKLERECAQRSLSEHLQDFMATREKSGVCTKYAKGQHKQLIRLFAECRWKAVADVQRDSFECWRNRTDVHPKTLNEYLGTANVFLKWMEGCERIPSNPLSKVPTVETRGRDKRKRRAFTRVEIARLLGVSGPRAVVVLLALYTGLRRGELGWEIQDTHASPGRENQISRYVGATSSSKMWVSAIVFTSSRKSPSLWPPTHNNFRPRQART